MNAPRLVPAMVGACLALLAILFGTPVQAFLPPEQGQVYEVPLDPDPTARVRTASHPAADFAGPAQRGAIDRFSARQGGRWRMYAWNARTKTPHLLYGSGAPLLAGPAAQSEFADAARQLLAANRDVFKADPAALRLTATPQALGKTAVHFQQTYQGLDVWSGGARLLFTDDGRLFAAGADAYDGIDVDPTPQLSPQTAGRIATADLPFDAATDSIEAETPLLILPVPGRDGTVTYHLVYRLRVHTRDPLGIWVTHVDAHDGALLWRYNDIHFLDFSGTASGEIEPGSYCNGLETQPLEYLRIRYGTSGSTTTNALGEWDFANAAESLDVAVDLYGPYADIYNAGGSQALYLGRAYANQPLAILLDDSNSQRDERDVFDTIADIHDLFGLFDPSYPYVNQRIIGRVSLDATCNAYWDGTINFFRAGGACANTGQVQGVVAHEFGHGVQASILGWQGDQGLGEGNADILANLLTEDSVIGRGFYLDQCSSGIRNSENRLVYPDDVIDQAIHYAGQVIAGFHWDFLRSMQGLYGPTEGLRVAAERWHFGRILGLPTTQPDQVLATFLADDDDGNLDNGTPHHDYLCAAARNHGFDCPTITTGVLIDHAPLASTDDPQDFTVRAEIVSTLAPLDPDSLLLRYRINGGAWQALTLAPAPEPDTYQAVLSGIPQPSEVEYYLRAVDQLSNTRSAPALAPLVVYAFDVATLYEPFEAESGWAVNLEGTDTALAGLWERVDPIGTLGQPEDDHTPDPGTICWVTGNAEAGAQPGANDVDGGLTSLTSPAYNLSGALAARVKYWRWYSNSTGSSPYTDVWLAQVRNNEGPWIDVENGQEDQNQWVEREVDLAALYGSALGTVRFRFVASDLEAGSLVEAGLDDFAVLAQLDFAAAEEPAARALAYALHGPRTSPVVGATRIAFAVPAPTQVRIDLYDVTGRNLRRLAHERFAAGTHDVAWDGRNRAGQSVAAGIYYVRMQAAGFTATRTIVVSR